jgi:hypothetical protein
VLTADLALLSLCGAPQPVWLSLSRYIVCFIHLIAPCPRTATSMGTNNSVPADYSTAAYALIGLDIFLIISAVAGRTGSRRLMKAKISADDILTYLAFVCTSSALF